MSERIEENIDYHSLLFGYGDAELSEKIRNAIRHLLQAYKEEKQANTSLSLLNAELSFKIGKYEEKAKVAEAMIEEMANSIYLLPNDFKSVEDVIEFFRDRVVGGKR